MWKLKSGLEKTFLKRLHVETIFLIHFNILKWGLLQKMANSVTVYFHQSTIKDFFFSFTCVNMCTSYLRGWNLYSKISLPTWRNMKLFIRVRSHSPASIATRNFQQNKDWKLMKNQKCIRALPHQSYHQAYHQGYHQTILNPRRLLDICLNSSFWDI